jgi:hypothetical protein
MCVRALGVRGGVWSHVGPCAGAAQGGHRLGRSQVHRSAPRSPTTRGRQQRTSANHDVRAYAERIKVEQESAIESMVVVEAEARERAETFTRTYTSPPVARQRQLSTGPPRRVSARTSASRLSRLSRAAGGAWR